MSCHRILKQRGYRLTPQRVMVVEAVHNADKHISAEEIFVQVKARHPYANISTVYRTLDLMERLGLVIKTDFGEGYVRYHHMEKSNHHHLICEKCGTVIDLEGSALMPLQKGLLKGYNFKVDLRHLAISGLCASCQGKEES